MNRRARLHGYILAGDHCWNRYSGRYLGRITEVRAHSIRFAGPIRHAGRAMRSEIRVGPPPLAPAPDLPLSTVRLRRVA